MGDVFFKYINIIRYKINKSDLRCTPSVPKCLSRLIFYVNFDHLFY
jgi:hypothetical protein